MENTQVVNSSVILANAINYFLVLTDKIFLTRDFADVDQPIADAIKIMYGIEAIANNSVSYNVLPPTSWYDAIAWPSKNATQFIANATGGPSDYISYQPCVISPGQSISFTANLTITSGSATVALYLADNNLAQLSGTAQFILSPGNNTITLTGATQNSTYIVIDGQHSVGTYNFAITLTSIGNTLAQTPNTDGYAFPQSINAQQTQQILVCLNTICPKPIPVYTPDF